MSDFDKEAEREKLREKFEQEEEQRAATEQMSELLLKGATMTNAHCTDCGDPIFRYDGQEFCPTCQKPVTRDQPEAGEEDDESDAGDHIEVADPSDEATVQFGASEDQANGADEQEAAAADEDSPLGEPAAEEQSEAPAAAADEQPAAEGQPASQPSDQPGSQRQPASEPTEQPAQSVPSVDPDTDPGDDPRPSTLTDSSGASVSDQLTAAESNLAATVERFARRAAETDDPRAAREHLKAAREAAEALDAVRY